MCEDFRFTVNYYDRNGKIRQDLFSDEAERVVKCFLSKFLENEFKKNKEGQYKCKKDGWKLNCPEKNRETKKSISYSQIRKFYDEVLNFKAQLDNGKSFEDILPYFRMLKAKANVSYQRDVINANFKIFIDKNVDYVGDDEEKFKIFCTFFEAVVAYSKGTLKD